MAEVIPFKGILYNASRVSGEDVIAPPYDIITPELRKTLYAKNPYNVARIDAGEEHDADDERENKYRRAADYLDRWQKEGILIRSGSDSFYAYEMDYESTEGRKRMSGFFGLVRLEQWGNGIYPHEETHSKPKADRLKLLNACRAHTSPIFSLYHSPSRKASGVVERVRRTYPYLEARDLHGAIHRLWIIENADDIMTITNDLAGRAVFIADGHHRYETALEFQRMTGKPGGAEPSDFVLMFLANIADGGITILPTHRIIRYNTQEILGRLSGCFEMQGFQADADITAIMRNRTHVLGLVLKGDPQQYLLGYSGNNLTKLPSPLQGLDVAVLHERIFKELLNVSDILYEMDPVIAKRKVRDGEYDAAFFLNPTQVEDVESVALSSVRMPPKSTYFYPKVMTGFIINSLNTP
ncbi:MAG: DUF1015 domain-containing protein [Thermodesulfovibrionales bacterium]|jgi:uncharacterized protein (DUF1015 family)